MKFRYSPAVKSAAVFALSVALTFGGLSGAQAQVATDVSGTTPASFDFGQGSALCSAGKAIGQACITLGNGSTNKKVDIFFLFDDTGSFASFVPTVTGIFGGLVSSLETAMPDVEFGFGVGRFEDFGGPGNSFSGENSDGRPFYLNQPIVTASSAGGSAARNTLISDALARTAPGYGGDGPESSIAEGLYQVAAGTGFDGNGDNLFAGFSGTQIAGELSTQTSPDDSGDVPAFSPLAPSVVASGTVGGAGFRSDALKIVILATDICSVAAFDSALGIPSSITGSNGDVEPISEFACASISAGASRFGFVSDSADSATNTIVGAVAPKGAHTVPQTVAALNAAGIEVLGMVPGSNEEDRLAGGPIALGGAGNAGVPSGSGPGFDPAIFLSALARLTNGVDSGGNPLVFSIGAGGDVLRDSIVAAVLAAAQKPINISLQVGGSLPGDLSFTPDPSVASDVGPGQQACFDVDFAGTPSTLLGGFSLKFVDVASGVSLGSVPASVSCVSDLSCTSTDVSIQLNLLDGTAHDQQNLVIRAAKLLNGYGKKGKKLATQLSQQASELYLSSWNIAHTLPSNILSCSDNASCVEVSNSSLLDTYLQNAKQLNDLAKQVIIEIKKLSHGKKVSANLKRVLLGAQALLEKSLKAAGNVPTTTSSCTLS